MDERREQIERVVRAVLGEWLAAGDGPAAGAEPGPLRRPREAEALRRPLVAANWKMHGEAAMARDYACRLLPGEGAVEVVLCPPAVLLPVLAAALGPLSPVSLGAQNLHPEPRGAFTGEHSPGLVRDAGARYAIVGHSERRALFGDSDERVAAKVRAALQAGLRPILCVGERLAERETGATFRVLRGQLTAALAGLGPPAPEPAEVVLAYEPVWAIGTGRNASPAQAQEAMGFIRERLAELFGWDWARRVRLLYGGSATPDNAAALAAEADADGFLVGGAGLDPDKLSAMIAALARAKAGGRR